MKNVMNQKATEALVEAVLALRNGAEAKAFLRDLLTESELSEFASRWQAAQMLSDEVPYITIVKKTGLSSTTVARISKWLQEGMGGYRLMIDRIQPSTSLRLNHHTHALSAG